jgi:hypothetical protein
MPITTAVMLRAAQFWAQARKTGKPTADNAAIDADVILAAQAAILIDEGSDTVIATSNPRHLALFAPAAEWQSIYKVIVPAFGLTDDTVFFSVLACCVPCLRPFGVGQATVSTLLLPVSCFFVGLERYLARNRSFPALLTIGVASTRW